MTEIGTLQRQTRLLLQEVLNEKTIVIEEQMRQILQYRQEIDRLGTIEKQKHGLIEELQLDSLLQNKLIAREGNNYHLLVDVTQIMRQGVAAFCIDARVDIVKEIEDDRHKAYQSLSEAYARLNEENKGLVNKAAERDKQHEAVVKQLNEQMAKAKEEFAIAKGELQGKIQILQDENEMMEIQAKQQKVERSHYAKEKDLRQECESLSKKYEEKMQLISKLTVQHEQLKQRLQETEQKTHSLVQQNKQLIVQNKELLEKCEQLKKQNIILKENIDESGLTSKVEILRLTPVQTDQQQYFESKAKVYEQKCTELLKENQDYSESLIKIQRQKNSLLQRNAILTSLLENKQQRTKEKPEGEKEKSEIDEQLLPFWSELQTLLKQLSAQNQIIIRNKQASSQRQVLSTSRHLQVNLLSKLSGKKARQLDDYLLISPAEKDTSFPVAQTPQAKIQSIEEKQATKSKHRKKMIRIGY